MEHPIIFTGESVRAIREGRKTQTRRVLRPQPEIRHGLVYGLEEHGRSEQFLRCKPWRLTAPEYKPGDVLWVREAWQPRFYPSTLAMCEIEGVVYADGAFMACDTHDTWDMKRVGKWRASIHMPRWACRLLLPLTAVRVERVQEITEEDAKAEGCAGVAFGQGPNGAEGLMPVTQYMAVWYSLNAKRGYSWAANPWVWVLTFERQGA